jgi:ABC-type transport system substrate-binding protein
MEAKMLYLRSKTANLLWATLVIASLILTAVGCSPAAQPTQPPPTQAPPPTAAPVAPPTQAPPPTAAPAAQPTQAATATTAPTVQPTQPPAAPTLTPSGEQPVRGGTLTAAFSEDPNSLDSILGYNVAAWQGLMNLYRGLMIFDGDHAVPDMADGMPDISADGLVYTFKIKPGIKFSNGREVVAADFKYSLERCLDPDWASWANNYLISIKGAKDVIDGKTKDASGIEVVDKYTIRFTLTAPDMTFLNVLALPNNWVVPKEEVDKWGKDFEKHPVGTGPFVLKEFTPGEKVVFVRNPYYFHEGQPFIDQMVMQLGVDSSTALLRLEKGDLDVLWGDSIPPAEFPRLIADPKYSQWLYREPSMYTWWLGLNNKVKPLDNVLVRQALNMAVNRDKVTKLTAGKGQVLSAIYPSTAPGYDPNYKPYTYDPAAAKAKLKEAGLPAGTQLELLVSSQDPLAPTLAQSIQQDLLQVGLKVTIKQAADTAVSDLITAGNAQMYLNSWYMIQPDPADLIDNLYMTGAGSNQDFYSNPKVDDLGKQALAEQDRAKRIQLYQQIEHMLMDDAVHVPLFTNVSYYMYNPKIQGFYSRSEYGPYFERMWIKP